MSLPTLAIHACAAHAWIFGRLSKCHEFKMEDGQMPLGT